MKTIRENSESIKDVHSRLGKVSRLRELSGTDEIVSKGGLDTKVTDLITDSRRVTPGSAFLQFQD